MDYNTTKPPNFSDNEKRDSSREITKVDATKSLNELKHLEKTLSSLINSGEKYSAEKYLEGFLDERKVKSLQDYFDKIR